MSDGNGAASRGGGAAGLRAATGAALDTVHRGFRGAVAGVLRLLFPSAAGCPLCGRDDPDLGPGLPCRACRAFVVAAWEPEAFGGRPVPRCPVCGRALDRPGVHGVRAEGATSAWGVAGTSFPICSDCRDARPPFVAARGAAPYEGPIRAAIRRLKYSGESYLAPVLADFMAPVLAKEGWLVADALVPVPLHPRKAVRRGYNQAELLARELGRRYALPVLPAALTRTRETPPQARQGRHERLVSMTGAFAAAPAACAGKTLVLIDDVFTTGSTAASAAQALLTAGAKRVFVLTAAAGN